MIAFVFILFFGLVAAWLVAPKPDPALVPPHHEPSPESASTAFSRA